MAKTGETSVAARIGGRPVPAAKSGCGGCGHPRALHSNGTTPCRAYACTAGPGGTPCQSFIASEGGDEEERVAS